MGSLRVVADSAGVVVKRIDYDSFGNIITDTNETFKIPFGFAGGLHDRDTGLVRFGFRDYDPDIGRWTAKDPIFFNGGDTDLYGYVLNEPINGIDPHGLFVGSVIAKVLGKIAGQTAQEAAVGGQIADSMISATLSLGGESLLPQSSNTYVQSGALALQMWGAYSTASLALVMVGTAPVGIPLILSFSAGIEIGLLINKIPVYGTDETIGTWYGNYFYELMHKRDDDPCN